MALDGLEERLGKRGIFTRSERERQSFDRMSPQAHGGPVEALQQVADGFGTGETQVGPEGLLDRDQKAEEPFDEGDPTGETLTGLTDFRDGSFQASGNWSGQVHAEVRAHRCVGDGCGVVHVPPLSGSDFECGEHTELEDLGITKRPHPC